jgi:predicted membrane protein
MEPQNINRRFDETQKKLYRRFYACVFISVSSVLFTLIGLIGEFEFTKNRALLATIFIFAIIVLRIAYKIEKRIEQNQIDASADKSIKHIKTKF